MRIDPSDSSVYLLCGVDFLKSADGGDTWTRKAGPEGERIWDLNVGPGRPAVLYGARLGEVWKSSDGAESWQRSGKLPDGASLGAAHPTNSSAIFGTTRDGIIRSDNGGEAWTALTEQPFLGEISFRLLIDAGAPDVLYAISSERQQLRLHDRQTFLLNLLGERQVSPGSLVAIYGRDLAIETQVANSTPLPLDLGGTSVLFNDQAAPLLFVSSNQINAQVPFGLKGPVSMKVRRTDATFDQQTVTVLPQAVVILRENPTRLSDPLLFHAIDFRRVSSESPARRGEALTLFAVGMSELEFSIPAGALPPTPPPQLSNPPCIAFFESGSARPLAATLPLWAGAAPGLVGVYQVNFQIPDSLGAGSYSASLTDRVFPDFYGDECIPGQALDSFPLDVQ
jgi:uncharacterized protein (TIGR03437 family)